MALFPHTTPTVHFSGRVESPGKRKKLLKYTLRLILFFHNSETHYKTAIPLLGSMDANQYMRIAFTVYFAKAYNNV